MITLATTTTTSEAATVSGGIDNNGSGGLRLVPVTPLDLLMHRSAAIALIDVDNIVIGRDGRIHRYSAMRKLSEVYAQLNTAGLSLAVMSASCHEALGHEPWFRFPKWTWRVADVGQNAADHQLLDFAHGALGQRVEGRVAVASGDGIFAELAEVAALEVVVPVDHHGVSARLRPYLRVRGSRARPVSVPAQSTLDFADAA